MKILLSAYACEPDKGSEPGVGWHWAIELAQTGHEVWVITRENNRKNINSALPGLANDIKPHFIYYDLPPWAKWWKKGGRGVRLYYFLWQIGAFFQAKKSHKKEKFDKVHHVTFVSVRQPSFMGNLGIPFTFGPVAGGEHAPWKLRRGYGLRGWLLDAIRDVMNFIVKFDPFMWMTFIQAETIFATSQQTKNLIPTLFHKKTKIQLAIAYESKKMVPIEKQNDNRFNLLFIGRFIYWKGMHLGIAAFAELLKSNPDAKLTLIGKGPDRQRWQALAKQLKIHNNINWIDWVEQSALADYFNEHDVFLFPSLHDSGGMVVLEAMAYGLPCVCLDLGGPAIMTNNNKNGLVIDTGKKSEKQLIRDLSEALILLNNDSEFRKQLGQKALQTSNECSWQALVAKIYN